MSVIFRCNFRSLSKKTPHDFLKYNFFTIHSPCQANFRRKRKPKIFGFKNVTKRGIRKILTFIKCSNFRENKTEGREAIVLSKSFKFPQEDRTDTNLIALLRFHFQRPKSTLHPGQPKKNLQCIQEETVVGCPWQAPCMV